MLNPSPSTKVKPLRSYRAVVREVQETCGQERLCSTSRTTFRETRPSFHSTCLGEAGDWPPFELAKDKKAIEDLRLHDFRHTCITRWSTIGIPREIVMAASGHSSIQMHDGYVNVKENHLQDAFKMLTTCSHEKQVDEEKSVSY